MVLHNPPGKVWTCVRCVCCCPVRSRLGITARANEAPDFFRGAIGTQLPLLVTVAGPLWSVQNRGHLQPGGKRPS
jgi:hypothetical protein